MTNFREHHERVRFARFMRAYRAVAPIAAGISAELESEGLDPTGPEFEHRLKAHIDPAALRALID